MRDLCISSCFFSCVTLIPTVQIINGSKSFIYFYVYIPQLRALYAIKMYLIV